MVELLVGAVRKAAVEEALVTAFATVGVASQDVVQEPLHEAFSSGAVEVVASAIGTLGVLILNGVFTHGTSLLLLGEKIIALRERGSKTRLRVRDDGGGTSKRRNVRCASSSDAQMG